MSENRPVVLSISGHDPSGGAGVQADIETLAALKAHACTVITSLTFQDTRNIQKIVPQPAKQIRDQVNLIFEDLDIRCIKIGLLGSLEIVSVLHDLLLERVEIPVVLDPVLAAGGGFDFSDQRLVRAIADELVPLATVTTPNAREARKLCSSGSNLLECGVHLNALGCGHVLITGADEHTPQVVNTLYRSGEAPSPFNWERLGGTFHGSGCTLASAIAAFLARGSDPYTAINEAQQFTWESLKAGFRPGKGQSIPDRLFQARNR